MGIFKKLAEKLSKTREAISRKFFEVFNRKNINDEFYEDLYYALISADVGVEVSERIIEELKDVVFKKRIKEPIQAKDELKQLLLDEIDFEVPPMQYPAVILVSGVNGTGKTTSIGKLAYKFKKQGKRVLLAAGDTFRAAAAEQLTIWADRAGVRIVKHAEGADPASVVYDAIQSAKAKNNDVLIVDTAGRLQNKKNLMDELGKIYRVIDREYKEATVYSLIVVDATIGQNAVSQVDVFDEVVDIDGIILTKLDGTAKGGVVIAISGQKEIPVLYVGLGEGIDDLEEFNAKEFIDAII